MITQIRYLGVAMVLLILFSTTESFAAGTPSGTKIKNVAKMEYKDLAGTSFDPIYSDTATVEVEQVAGVSLSPTGTLQYSSDSMYVYYPHVVTNTGNGTDSYTITGTDSAGWSPNILFDANGNGIWDSGENTMISTITNLAADASYKVIVRIFVPNGTVSSFLDTIRTQLTSGFNNGTDPIATTWVRDSVKTKVAEVAVNKTNGNTTPKPGDVITYTISYANNGTGSAQNSTLTDTLDLHVSYVASSATINSGGGTVEFLTEPNRIVWSNIGSSGNITAGTTGQMTFQVTVNAGVTSGTVISNIATLAFTDNISGRNKHPKSGISESEVTIDARWNLAVEVAGGSAFDSHQKTDSVDVSQSIRYRFKLTNLGNYADTATIAQTSLLPLSWTLYVDVDSSGTKSTSDALYSGSTGIIGQGKSIYFVAYDTVSQSVQDRRIDTAKYVATSVTNNAKDSVSTYSKIKAPSMQLSKGVLAQSKTWSTQSRTRPGDTLVYTITYTNSGSGTANQIVISDISPNNTTFISGSVSVNNSANGNTFTSKTDADDIDEVTVSSGTITVNLGSVDGGLFGKATSTGKIQFKVKIN